MPEFILTLFAIVVYLFPFTYTPGSGNMFFAICGARDGARSTIVANIGYHCANWVTAVLLGLGVSEILNQNPTILSFIRGIGGLYVLWIAWKIFRSDGAYIAEVKRTATFFDGILIFFLNPKAYISLSLAFSLFVESFGFPSLPSVLILSTVFVINNMLAFHLWALLGQNIASRLSNRQFANATNTVFAILLVAVAFWIVLS